MKILYSVKTLALTLGLMLAVTVVNGATYYTFTNSAPESLNNWWNGTGGIGTHPANFTTVGDVFIIQNNNTMTTANDWTVTGTVQINSGCTLTVTSGGTTLTVGSLTINSGGTLTCSRPCIVNGAGGTIITGTINLSGANRASTFVDLTLNSGAIWNYTATSSSTIGISGNFTNNATTFTASNMVYTFSGTGKNLSGGTTSIPNVAITGTYTNNNTLTVSTALSGAGGLTNTATGILNIGGSSAITTLSVTAIGNIVNYNGPGSQTIKDVPYDKLAISGSGTKTWTLGAARTVAGTLDVASGAVLSLAGSFTITISGATTNNGTLTTSSTTTLAAGTFTNYATGLLNIGGAPAITTLNASAAGNTVNYTGAVQTVIPVTYSNLTLSGSGIKTTSGVTVNGILSMEGTATVSVLPTYGGAATLQYNTATSRSPSVEWVSPFVASGGVKIANTGTITLNGGKVFGASTNVPLTINNGATLSTSASNYSLTFHGDFINNGTLTAGSSAIIMAGTTATQNIGGFTTTGTVSMTKTGGTATFTANVSGAGLTISGSGGTLNLGSGLTHTFSGTWTRTAGTLNGGSSTINFSVPGTVVSGTVGTFTPNTGTINYSRAGAQTVAALTYNNLTLSGTGSNAKTITTGTIVNGVFSREGTATVTLSGTLTYGSSAILQYKGSVAQITGAEFPATFAGSQLAGITIENTLGVTLNTVKDIGARSFTIGSIVASSVFSDGGFQLTATGTLNLTSGTFKLGAAAATTFPAFGTRNVAIGTTVEYAATTTQTIKGMIYSNLTISGTGTNSKKADADITVNGTLNLVSANASTTQGCLEMTKSYVGYPGTTNSAYLDSWKLHMGSSSSTTGTGDVTGTVVRNYTLSANTPYTFGNQYTTVSLTPGTMPTALAVTITIGTVPPGKADAIKRTYEIVPTGGSGSAVTANFHYLDSELNSNTETSLVTWDYDMGGTGNGFNATPDEHGRASFDNTNNYIGLANIPVEYFIQVPVSHDWRTLFTLANFGEDYITWNGSASSDWTVAGNWTLSSGGSGIPNSLSHVIIPNTSSTNNDPVLPSGITINTLSLSNGGVLIMGGNTLTIQNSLSGGWDDQNPSGNDPGTSTVIFSKPGTSISGNARFYNVQIGDGADITNEVGSTMKIANSITKTGTGKWYADVYDDAIEYNGGAQTILLPDGTPSYHTLIISGSGIKTMPASPMSLHGDLILNGSASATAGASIFIGGNVILSSGTTFNASSYSHIVSGNWTNNGGTFTPGSSTITFDNTTAAQAINGTTTSQTFNSIVVAKTAQSLSVSGSTTTINTKDLGITSGTFNTGTTTNINVTGNWSNSGTFAPGIGTVTFNGSTAQNIGGNNAFNNLTINNLSGVTATTDQTVNGVLNLVSTNASAMQGTLEMGVNTLIMGPTATTLGDWDVSGIVKRTAFLVNTPYTFGSQYTTLDLTAEGTLPTSISVKLILTAAKPSFMDTVVGVYRYYDIIQAGNPTAKATLNLHYLDTELHGAIEEDLDIFDYHVTAGILHDHGSSNFNSTNNWVGLANLSLAYIAKTDFNQKYLTLGTSVTGNDCVWLGVSSPNPTDWNDAGNWIGGVPTETSHVHIGNATNHPTLPASAAIGYMSIETGGVVNGGTETILTITGAAGAWDNLGTFNPGTSNVVFTNVAATMADPTNFYNVTVANGASLTLGTSNIMRIAGTLSLSNTGILNAANNQNTVEYNGADQTIVNPNGLTPGYHNLVLSGSGTKTMPSLSLNIGMDFSITGSASVTSSEDLNIVGALSVENGTTLTISAGKAITVAGTTNLGGTQCLVLKSDASGTASFIDNGTISGTGTMKAERYLAPYNATNDYMFHFLSSPVENQAIVSEFSNPPAMAGTDFYAWDEVGYQWINARASGDVWNTSFEDNFIQGKGYMVAYPSPAVIKNFIGKPYTNSTGLTKTCTYTAGKGNGWNLLGNPFPSPINWETVTKGDGIDAALYYYDNTAANYRYYSYFSGGLGGGSQYIPAMQGFMVHANATGAQTVTMKNSDRIHTDLGNYYKRATMASGILDLKVEGNGYNDYARVCFYVDATSEFDGDYDAYKMWSYNTKVPQIYMVTPGNAYLAINTLPVSVMEGGTIPVSFNAATAGNFTITAETINTFSPDIYISLEDKVTGKIQRLSSNQPVYSFTATPQDATDRFVLHFLNATSVSDLKQAKDFSVYVSDGILNIQSLNQLGGKISVTDMVGRTIATGRVEAGSDTQINIQRNTGVYIVSVLTAKGRSNTKIMVK